MSHFARKCLVVEGVILTVALMIFTMVLLGGGLAAVFPGIRIRLPAIVLLPVIIPFFLLIKAITLAWPDSESPEPTEPLPGGRLISVPIVLSPLLIPAGIVVCVVAMSAHEANQEVWGPLEAEWRYMKQALVEADPNGVYVRANSLPARVQEQQEKFPESAADIQARWEGWRAEIPGLLDQHWEGFLAASVDSPRNNFDQFHSTLVKLELQEHAEQLVAARDKRVKELTANGVLVVFSQAGLRDDTARELEAAFVRELAAKHGGIEWFAEWPVRSVDHPAELTQLLIAYTCLSEQYRHGQSQAVTEVPRSLRIQCRWQGPDSFERPFSAGTGRAGPILTKVKSMMIDPLSGKQAFSANDVRNAQISFSSSLAKQVIDQLQPR